MERVQKTDNSRDTQWHYQFKKAIQGQIALPIMKAIMKHKLSQ